MKLIIASILSFSFLVGCSTTANQPLAYSTKSGKPERSFSNKSVKEVKNRIADVCVSDGWQITDEGGSTIACWKTMEGNQAIFAQLLIGNSYSTPPTQHLQIVVTERNGSVIATASRQWIETQMAFGQVNRQELNSNRHLNDAHRFLQTL